MRTIRGSAALLFVCSVFVLFSLAQGILFSVVLSNSGNENWLVRTVAIIDGTTGSITNITDNGYIPVDGNQIGFGISAFDANAAIYYFADDSTDYAVIHATSIFNKTKLPDVKLNVNSVTNFNYDNVNDRLLLFYSNNDDQSPVLASFQQGNLKDLWKPNLKLGSVGFDESTQRLFMINATSLTDNSFAILDLNTFKSSSIALPSACQSFRYSGRLLWSPTQKRVYTIAPYVSNSRAIDIYMVMIDPSSGYCQPIKLQGVPIGFITDWAIDDTMNRIFFSQEVVQGELLFEYDIALQLVLPPSVWPPNNHPMNLATSPY